MAEEEERRNLVEREASDIRSSSGGAGEPSSSSAASSAVAVAVAGDETTAREDARNNVKKKVSSSTSSSSAAAGSSAHRCEKCGRTFATGQSLGGHMRKHYDGPPIIANKKRTREQQPEETPAAPTADRKVRMASHFDALPSQSQEETERSSGGNGARRLHNLIALLEKGPKNAPQPEPERKDDDALLSLRLGQYNFPRSSSGV